jgi:hypothetical protein
MLSDPRDAYAYRVAIGFLGIALVVVLAGLCAVSALGVQQPRVEQRCGWGDSQGWSERAGRSRVGSADGDCITTTVTGAQVASPYLSKDLLLITAALAGALGGILALPIGGLGFRRSSEWQEAVVLVLLLVFTASLVLSVTGAVDLGALSAAGGGVLVGLLVPSPAIRESAIRESAIRESAVRESAIRAL